MDYIKEREIILNAGHKLLDLGLVKRTWGNISMRVSPFMMLITPSGLDYHFMKEEDIVEVDLNTKKSEGGKPSSEKGIHEVAYQVFKDDSFVLHTHQDFATVMGIVSFIADKISKEEKEELGGISIASYGISSTKKLALNVKDEFEKGSHTVLMPHHGVVFVAKSVDEAFKRALLLEEIGKRLYEGPADEFKSRSSFNFELLFEKHPDYSFVSTPEVRTLSLMDILRPSVDDFAQMVGPKVYSYNPEDLSLMEEGLKHSPIVLVKDFGAIVRGKTEEDSSALLHLIQKEALVYLAARVKNIDPKINSFTAFLEHFFYNIKYAKRIKK